MLFIRYRFLCPVIVMDALTLQIFHLNNKKSFYLDYIFFNVQQVYSFFVAIGMKQLQITIA